jgi:hypothetical protein
MRFADIAPVVAWAQQNFGPESCRWMLEYSGNISDISVRWCFQDKQDLDLFLHTWDSRA